MKKYFTLGFFACVLAVSLTFQRIGQTQQPPKNVGAMIIANRVIKDADGNRISPSINVALLKGDDVVRSAVLSVTVNPGDTGDLNGNAWWQGVPVGTYELHIEADGFGKTIRRIAVAPGERSNYIIDRLAKVDTIMGARPTFAEIDQRLKAVETENAQLKARIATLEK